ncbi:MAG: GH25 family lysozyme [Oscillospiraceae bacterium]
MANILTKGIDVSKHNGVIDWSKAKNDINFAIIRAGYGRLASQKDIKFEKNYQGCVDNNIPKGAYWYSYATTVADIKTEAKVFLETIKGKKFEYPVYLDIEEQSQANLSSITLNAMIKAFCDTLETQGYFVGVYSYDSFFNKVSTDVQSRYSLWVANTSNVPQRVKTYGIHQHSFKGSVSGIKGAVDLNNCYVDFPTVIKSNGLNGYSKVDTSNYHYDVNNDGKVDSKDLQALQEYLNK